jgi:hypothetical protein
LRFFNHSAKFVAFRVIVRIAILNDFWFNAQSVKARFFLLICLKNRTMSRRSWWLAEDNLIIAEKSRLLFTNSRRRCVCRMMWSLRNECFEVKLINREVFTRCKRSTLSKIEDEWRSKKKKVEEEQNWWVKILEAQITARVQLNASSNSKDDSKQNLIDWFVWISRDSRRSIAVERHFDELSDEFWFLMI